MPKEFFCKLQQQQVNACPEGLRTCHKVVRWDRWSEPDPDECCCVERIINDQTRERRVYSVKCSQEHGCFWCWPPSKNVCPTCGAELEKNAE